MLNMSIRKSPRLAALAAPAPRRSPRLAEAKAAARAAQAERAETAAARVEAHIEAPLRRSARINKPSEPEPLARWQVFLGEIQAEQDLEALYMDRDEFTERYLSADTTEGNRMDKFVKDLYIKFGLFQPCEDVFLPCGEDALGAVLIKINGNYCWLSGLMLFDLERRWEVGGIALYGEEGVELYDMDSDSDSDYEVYKH